MTMHTIFTKGNEGIVQHTTAPWWANHVIQSVAYNEPFGHLKSASVEQPISGNHVTATKNAEDTAEFTSFSECQSGDSKSSEKAQKPSSVLNAVSMQSSNMDYQGHFELGFGQPLICAKYPYGEKCLGLFSTVGSQLADRIMLPLNLTSDEGPIFVNAKQYHGILRRRKFRAKEMEKKVLKPRKQFLHLSRHLHAMRRPRGCGGRFMNTRKMNGRVNGDTTYDTTKTGSQNSEVLQSDISNFNSPTGRRSYNSSEVTSLYSRGNVETFPIHNPRPSVHSLLDMMNTGHDILMASKWGPAADSCCNLKI